MIMMNNHKSRDKVLPNKKLVKIHKIVRVNQELAAQFSNQQQRQ